MVTAKAADGRIMARAKSNVGPDGGGFAYDLQQIHASGMEASRVVWGAALQGTARELLGGAEMAADSPRDGAREWLEDLLSDGEVPVTDAKSDAKAAGISWRTIERAKGELGVVAERMSSGNTGGGYWTWRLPKTAKPKAANPALKSGGLAESQAPRGFEGDLRVQDRQSHGGGLAARNGSEVTL